MGQAYWAAREGDILLHTSLLADIAGAAVEIACYAAIATACIAAAAVAIGLFTATGGAAALALGAVLGTASTSACVVGTIVSVGVSIALEKYISQAADWVSSLFPPSEDGKIKTGSHNTRTNSKHSARAAGIVKKAETTQAPQQPEGFIDTAANILQGLKTAASQFIRPTVASPDPSTTEPRDDDKITCKKHPSSFSDIGMPSSPALGVLELGFSVVSAAIGTITGAAEYMAEGSKKSLHQQPAGSTQQ